MLPASPGITPGHHCLPVTTPPLLQNPAAQDHVLKAALNTPALASLLLLVEKHEAETDWCWPYLYTATPFLQHSTIMHFCPGGSLHAPHPMPHPKVPDGTDGGCLQVAHACGVSHVVVGCSAALVKPLLKETLNLASVSHAMKGEGRKRLGSWQTALAPNLSQLP